MKKVRSKVPKGSVSDASLTSREKVSLVILFLITAPLWNALILYNGWKDVLPRKAKGVRNIALIVIGVLLLVIISVIALTTLTLNKLPSNATVSVGTTNSTQTSALLEYKNDELGVSFQYPSKYGEVIIKKIPGIKGFAFIGQFTKSDPGYTPYFFGGKSPDYQSDSGQSIRIPSFINDTINNYGNNIKVSDISNVSAKGILLSANPQGDDNFYTSGINNWREVVFVGNKNISNLVFVERLDVFPGFIDMMGTVKIY